MLTYANDFAEFLQRRDAGERIEIDEELFDYFLEVLPPAGMGESYVLADGTDSPKGFGFAEGAELITAFWQANGKHYAQLTCHMNGWR